MSEPVPERVSVASELFDRRRLVLVLAVLLVEFAIFFAGLLTPVSVSTQRTLANETNSQIGPFLNSSPVQLVVLIFTHNLPIALVEMVPLLGELLFVFSVYGTGLTAQALAVSSNHPSQWGALIFVFPYSYVELTAYAMAVAAGVMLLVSWRRRRLRRELRVFALEGLAVAAILLVAAAMETTTIRISVILGLALWLPTGLALASIIALTGRRRT